MSSFCPLWLSLRFKLVKSGCKARLSLKGTDFSEPFGSREGSLQKSYLGVTTASRVQGTDTVIPTPGKFFPEENTDVIVFLQLPLTNAELRVWRGCGEQFLNSVISRTPQT